MCTDSVAIKDLDAAHPISALWRPLLLEVIARLAKGDFELSNIVEGVLAVDPEVATINRENVLDYGEILTQLPAAAWDTSCAQYMGTYWEILVDLYTIGEGASDLVLHGRMSEFSGKPQFEVGLIYVP
ncbi:MAG: hypothetical protein HRU06_20860 [Oceanospirillaceae bacterium]|nr:hypothetical protein [Oceanospirillaceae bacterium]